MEELVLKMPVGKPPFVGVLFGSDDSQKASMLNAGWVNGYRSYDFTLLLEPVKNRVNIRLIQDAVGCSCVYHNLKYENEQLLKFLAFARTAKVMNFGHLLSRQEGCVLVKTITENRNFVLKIAQIKLVVEY